MRIKNIDQFTVADCENYLAKNPNGIDAEAVKKKLNKLQKQKLNKLYHIDWIDIKQFIYQTNYMTINKVAKVLKSILIFCLIFGVLNLVLATYIVKTGDCIDVISRYLDYMGLIDIDNHDYPEFEKVAFVWFCSVIVILCFVALINKFLSSPVLSKIHNIEEARDDQKILRMQNRLGKLGLCSCGIVKIKQLLPFSYDRIYPCGSDSYICEKEELKGVYNIELRRMVIPVRYNGVEILSNNNLKMTNNGHSYKFTTKGFRIVE